MAVLSASDRQALFAAAMSEASSRRDAIGLTKAELKAAVDAIDDWIDANAASFNTAIPQPARGALTARQKAWLFVRVLNRRWEVS